MKKIIKVLLVFTIVLISSTVIAQPISQIKPTHVVWKSDGQQVTLKTGKYGISQPDSLSIEIYFPQEYINQFNKDDLSFEFKWYYYFSTRKKLITKKSVNYNANNFKSNKSYLIHSTRGNITKGWWEVQIIALKDNGLLELGTLSKFQILIK